MVMHACMGPSSAMDCYTACSRVLGSWSFVGMFLVLGQGERPSANDSMHSAWREPRTKDQERWPCKIHAQRTKYTAGSQEPGTKDQEPRKKSQGPRAKDQDFAMHGPTAEYHIYIYMCVVPGSQFSKFQISRFPGLRSFNFPDSLILSDKLSDPNLTPFPTHAHMHAGTTYFARSPRWHMHYKVRGPQSPWDQGPWMQEPWTKSHGLQGARTKYIPKATYLKSQGPRAKDREPRNNQCIHKRYLYRHHHSA